jgi:hypothetical protein
MPLQPDVVQAMTETWASLALWQQLAIAVWLVLCALFLVLRHYVSTASMVAASFACGAVAMLLIAFW